MGQLSIGEFLKKEREILSSRESTDKESSEGLNDELVDDQRNEGKITEASEINRRYRDNSCASSDTDNEEGFSDELFEQRRKRCNEIDRAQHYLKLRIIAQSKKKKPRRWCC